MKLMTKNILACTVGSAAMMIAAPSMAQEANTFEDEVIATGIRSSLKQSLDFKRDSNQVVDAITAEDVGKFPDNNIAESLQRITGVSIDRSGGEGQFITVRGLGPEFNTVTLNGRTLATDNPGREFSFDVISSDIIQRAEVFKTSTPNLQSGGIGANVNIITGRPLSAGENSISASLAGTYDTLREKISPDATVVGNWQNDEGTIGFFGGVSYSDRATQRDRVLTNGFNARGGNDFINAPESSSGLTSVVAPPGVSENDDGDDIFSLPANARVQQQAIVSRDVQDRERITLNGTAQFRPSDTLELTVDALYSEFTIDSFDTQFSGFFSPPFINPVIDANGTVTSFSRPGADFVARNPLLGVGQSQNDNVLTSANRNADTYLIGANAKWDVRDDLTLNFDVSTSEANNDATNPFVVLGALAPASPLIELPENAEITTLTNIVGAQDPSIQRLHFVNVARNDVIDQILEFKGGGDWNIDKGPLTNIAFGASLSDRKKKQDFFDNFSPTQGFGVFCAYCGYTVDFEDSILQQANLDGFLGGVDGADRIPTQFLTASFEDAFAALNNEANIRSAAGRAGRGDISDDALIARRDASNSIFGFYEPDINPGGSFVVNEQVVSAFVNTSWEGDFGGDLPWSANIGFRIAETQTTSSGVDAPVTEFREAVNDTQLDIRQGPATEISIDNSYTNFLPSVNLKLETSDDTVVRFAASKTVTRPTLTALGVSNVFGGRSDAPTSSGGNPTLEAFESSNYDASFEWYIDDLTFFGVSAFHKRFSNFLESQTLPIVRPIVIPAGNPSNQTANDVTRDVPFQDTRTRNGETGNITGLELAVQKAWDNGLGAAFNYTYVTSNIDRAAGSGNEDLDYNGLSPHSFNANVFYEQGPWQGRIAYNYRDEFLVQAFADQGEPRQRESFGQVDFSAGYEVNEQFQVFVEGINVFDADTRDFSRFRNRFLTYEDTGSRYTVGVRGKF